MPLQATSGAASYDAFGGGAAAVPVYIEDVFSTWLYTGTGATQTITNGIDLSTKGGLVWCKMRSSAGYNHALVDTARGAQYQIHSNTTGTGPGASTDFTSFNTTGFTLGAPDATNNFNASAETYVSWTFRKQPKFFDVVTYTGNSVVGRQISHNLGSVPSCIIVKKLNSAGSWITYHRSIGATKYLALNTTAAEDTFNGFWNDTTPTSTVFTVGDAGEINDAGSTYVAYLFAHDAGGFGLTGTDNVISCGSFTTDGSSTFPEVTLGYEPQWVLLKRVSNFGSWSILDNMRGLTVNGNEPSLSPNNTNAEAVANFIEPTATGFSTPTNNNPLYSSSTYIYIAIRRGPMKVPTSGTSVFNPSYGLSASNSEFVNAGFPIDLNWRGRTTGDNNILQDRLRGASQLAFGNLTSAESTSSAYTFTTQNGCTFTSTANFSPWINWSFRRAPSFFDEVCFGSSPTAAIPHNLGVVPELIIGKDRTGTGAWYVWQPSTSVRYGLLNSTAAFSAPAGSWPATSTTFEPLIYGSNIVNYLFATCAGVSKCFNYTGNGSSQTINCGFTGGARWILIKRTDSTGDWYVWDSARGIVSGNDPHLSLNTTAAEVTTDDTIDTDSTGFVVNQVSATNVNVSSATYIGIAIA